MPAVADGAADAIFDQFYGSRGRKNFRAIVKRLYQSLRLPHPVWIVFFGLTCLLCLVAVRLGLRTASMTETDIIGYYSAQYLTQEQAEGREAKLIDCYAIAGTDVWVRMEVVCEPNGADSYRYIVGFWGQLLTATRAPLRQLAPQA